MVANLARVLHLSPTVFYMIFFATLVMASLALGFVLNRIIHYWTKKLANTWGELVFSLLESLPIPLLVLSSIYAGLELLTLPRQFKSAGAKLIFALTVYRCLLLPCQGIGRFPAPYRATEPRHGPGNQSGHCSGAGVVHHPGYQHRP